METITVSIVKQRQKNNQIHFLSFTEIRVNILSGKGHVTNVLNVIRVSVRVSLSFSIRRTIL